MTGIVCAIRGGPASQPTITHAVSLAQETGLPLYFLYIVNLDFLSHTTSSRVHTITQEMEQMGEFLLLTAHAAGRGRVIHYPPLWHARTSGGRKEPDALGSQ